jgi:hypothetical protein
MNKTKFTLGKFPFPVFLLQPTVHFFQNLKIVIMENKKRILLSTREKQAVYKHSLERKEIRPEFKKYV